MFLHKGKTTENIAFPCSSLGCFSFAVKYVQAQALLEIAKAGEETRITDGICGFHKF